MELSVNLIYAAIPSVISGIVLYKINRSSSRADEREKARIQENILILGNLDAIGSLSELATKCLQGQKLNGELQAALEYRKNQKHELEKHLIRVNAEMKGR